MAESIGKPEPLKEALKGLWSRGISREHRLIHVVVGTGGIQTLVILQCRYHD
ncbi:type II toxin-antitoxin system YoeB family toxin [Rhizobium sp. WL3]|uniref:type II toxin-antitoxin system YoeB family toxin n=1 Tax=Rhizobium sp. WL3 TaxID=2603277 RepID=UPI0011C1DFE8|nr:type II toxin-antitoxin system YoeB family toxin [Rhizobium sp. WL3]QEE44597.1 type II toxin-antitoxin system YoeB family toxin [Rhizobium sp. WL3]